VSVTQITFKYTERSKFKKKRTFLTNDKQGRLVWHTRNSNSFKCDSNCGSKCFKINCGSK